MSLTDDCVVGMMMFAWFWQLSIPLLLVPLAQGYRYWDGDAVMGRPVGSEGDVVGESVSEREGNEEVGKGVGDCVGVCKGIDVSAREVGDSLGKEVGESVGSDVLL